MPLRLFTAGSAGANGYTVSPAPSFYNAIVETTAPLGSSGNSVVLAAGASAISYTLNARFAAAVPNYSGTVLGSWRICRQFQAVTPTSVYTRVRVHRATLSGTTYTLVASSAWSGEVLTNKINQRFEMYLDQVDLGTWSTTDALVIEYSYRNGGAASVTPQPTGGGYWANAIYTPLTSSSGYGYTTQRSAGQRPYIYSRGGVRGTVRYGSTIGTMVSSGTATGTKTGQNYSGTVTGISLSTGSATGRANRAGTTTGSSTTTGSATGRAGYDGAVTGVCLSTGTATGTKSAAHHGGSVTPHTYVRARHKQVDTIQHATGRVDGVTYTGGVVNGVAAITGRTHHRLMSVSVVVGTKATTGTLSMTSDSAAHVRGTPRQSIDDESLLVMLGML